MFKKLFHKYFHRRKVNQAKKLLAIYIDVVTYGKQIHNFEHYFNEVHNRGIHRCYCHAIETALGDTMYLDKQDCCKFGYYWTNPYEIKYWYDVGKYKTEEDAIVALTESLQHRIDFLNTQII